MDNVRPGIANIDLFQNENYEEEWELTDDFTGEPYDISTASEIVLEVKENLRLHTIFRLTLGNGITIVPTNKIKILIHHSLTRKLSSKRYQFDVLFNLSGGTSPSYLVRGQINVINTISRIPS